MHACLSMLYIVCLGLTLKLILLKSIANVEEKKQAGLKVTAQGNGSEIVPSSFSFANFASDNSFKQGWSDTEGNSDELSEDNIGGIKCSCVDAMPCHGYLIMLVVTMTTDQLGFNLSSPRPPLTPLLIFFMSDFNALPSASEKIDCRAYDYHKIASCHDFQDSPGSMDLGFQGYIHSE